MIEPLRNITPTNGVFRLTNSSKFAHLENIYLNVRRAEGRVYTDDEVRHLPKRSSGSPHKNEWLARAGSAAKLRKYLQRKSEDMVILDLGCGNGWLANYLIQIPGSVVYAVDVNIFELEQGARVFRDNSQLHFIYADIFENLSFGRTFNAVILAGSVQYFSDVKALIERLLTLLAPDGEIHIIDSPFYTKEGALQAEMRTIEYARSIAIPEMTQYYHHHRMDGLSNYHVTKLYDPQTAVNKIFRMIPGNDLSPFPWLKITK
jgi:SAM-dependent methyltransferase